MIRFDLSAPGELPGMSRNSMKSPTTNNGMRAQYDFAAMKDGVRGKYAKRYRDTSNIVLLEPDVAEAFPNDESVNQALRGVLNTARAVRRTGGLANKSLQSTGRRQSRRSKRA